MIAKSKKVSVGVSGSGALHLCCNMYRNVFYTVKVYCQRVIHFSLWLCFANEVHYFLSLVYSIFLRWEISLVLKVKIKHLFWQDKEISDCPHSVSQSPGVTYYLPAF